MNNSEKVLKIVFFVLLVVVVAELSYFFIYQPKQTNLPERTNADITPTLSSNSNDNQLISQGYLEYLNGLEKKDGGRKIYLEEEMDGIISEINFEEFTREGRLFKGYFIMSNDKNEVIQKFSFTDNRIKLWKFYSLNPNTNEKELIDYKDLKVDQKIKFVSKIDLATDPNDVPLINEFIVQ